MRRTCCSRVRAVISVFLPMAALRRSVTSLDKPGVQARLRLTTLFPMTLGWTPRSWAISPQPRPAARLVRDFLGGHASGASKASTHRHRLPQRGSPTPSMAARSPCCHQLHHRRQGFGALDLRIGQVPVRPFPRSAALGPSAFAAWAGLLKSGHGFSRFAVIHFLGQNRESRQGQNYETSQKKT